MMLGEVIDSIKWLRHRSKQATVPRVEAVRAKPSVRCSACDSDALEFGAAMLDDARIAQLAGTMLGPWFPVAKEKYRYVEQSIYLCTSCGHIFISPVLSDQQTIDLIFASSNTPLVASQQWQPAPRCVKQPNIWSTAVRVPSINESLRPYLSGPVRLLDVGAHGGEISLNLDLTAGSSVDLLQLENCFTCATSVGRDLSRVREFRGLLADLVKADPAYRADLLLVLHVLEHVADLASFLHDCKRVLSDGGVMVVEVPYEPREAMAVARNLTFELPHHSFFTPWSLKSLLESNGFLVRQLEFLNHAHTGVGLDPYCVIRAVCSVNEAPTESIVPNHRNYFCWSLDRLIGSFGGSIAFLTDVPFVVFYFDPACQQLASLFEAAPGYRGSLTSNPRLALPNLFEQPPENVEFIITLNAEDRAAIRDVYRGPQTII